MENTYKFETDQFALSSHSIHLLRNRYNYETVDFDKIDTVVIREGKESKNWILILAVGLSLLAFFIFDLVRIYHLFFDSGVATIYIERLLIPLFPFFLGLYAVIISLRTTTVMIVQKGNKKYHFSLRQFIKKQKYTEFASFIREVFPMVNFVD